MDKTITIVSGLPRSGTSMMMKMLNAGGMEVLVDNIRKADEDNPNGYYEFEKVKKIKEDNSWLEDAEGKAVKMVSMLLYDLPPGRRYNIIFIQRIMDEVLASQRRMLERLGRNNQQDSDENMAELFGKHLREIKKWLEKQDNMNIQFIRYNDIIKKPLKNAKRLNKFLGKRLDAKKMAKVVNKSLYRQKAKAS